MTNDQFELLAQMIKGLHDHMDERFEQIDRRFDQIERRLDLVEQRLEHVEQRLDHLVQRVDALASTVTHLETEVRNVTGFIPEIRNHGERLVTVEAKLGIMPKPIKF